MSKSSLGIIGLGVMGRNLAYNALEKGHSVSAYNRIAPGEEELVEDFLTKACEIGKAHGFTDLHDFVFSLDSPRRILMMITAGSAIDTVLESLLPLLNEGDVIVDGSNSHYSDTERRQLWCQALNIGFVGVGVSGGEDGARMGPSLMGGGSKEWQLTVAPILNTIAAKDDSGSSCYARVGSGGAGHFVKMIHNGIEYAEMQLLAEVYDLLRADHNLEEIADILEEWNSGPLSSFLLESTITILRHRDERGSTLETILDKAGNKGTGSWSSVEALELGVPASIIVAAVFARYHSSEKAERVRRANLIVAPSDPVSKINLDKLKSAYGAARILGHHQGFAIIQEASSRNRWSVELSEVARIWTNGCILRSDLMNQLRHVLTEFDNLLDDPKLVSDLDDALSSFGLVADYGRERRVPLPCFDAARSSWVSATTASLPANLIQAQRDLFGAHRYSKVDRPESEVFHTDWKATTADYTT